MTRHIGDECAQTTRYPPPSRMALSRSARSAGRCDRHAADRAIATGVGHRARATCERRRGRRRVVLASALPTSDRGRGAPEHLGSPRGPVGGPGSCRRASRRDRNRHQCPSCVARIPDVASACVDPTFLRLRGRLARVRGAILTNPRRIGSSRHARCRRRRDTANGRRHRGVAARRPCVSVAPRRSPARVVSCASADRSRLESIRQRRRRWTATALPTPMLPPEAVVPATIRERRSDALPGDAGTSSRLRRSSKRVARWYRRRRRPTSAADPGVDHDVVEAPGGGGAHRRDGERDRLLAVGVALVRHRDLRWRPSSRRCRS